MKNPVASFVNLPAKSQIVVHGDKTDTTFVVLKNLSAKGSLKVRDMFTKHIFELTYGWFADKHTTII